MKGDDGRRGDRGHRAGADRGQERVERAPSQARAARHRDGPSQAAGAQGEGGHRGEGELEGRVAQRARVEGQDGECRHRQRAQAVEGAVEEDGAQREDGGERGAQHRHVGASHQRVEGRHRHRQQGRHPARVEPGRQGVTPGEERAGEAVKADRHHRQVEARDRQEVGEPAPREGVAGGLVDGAAVAGPDGPDQRRLASRQHPVGGPGESPPTLLQPRERGGRRDADRRGRGRGLERDAPGAQVRRPVATERVALRLGRPQAGAQADAVAQCERPGGSRGRDQEAPAARFAEGEAHPLLGQPLRHGGDQPLDKGRLRGLPLPGRERAEGEGRRPATDAAHHPAAAKASGAESGDIASGAAPAAARKGRGGAPREGSAAPAAKASARIGRRRGFTRRPGPRDLLISSI